MSTPQIKRRLGTLHDNREFYAWYLAQRRLARSGAGGATARVTEANQSRVTEDGQNRETQ